MTQATITEALAELKVLQKRIASKREFILRYAVRAEHLKDPLEKDGGYVRDAPWKVAARRRPEHLLRRDSLE